MVDAYKGPPVLQGSGRFHHKPEPNRWARWNRFQRDLEELMGCDTPHLARSLNMPDFAVVEGIAMRGVGKITILCEVFTAQCLTLHEHEIPIIEIPPTSLKMYITGSGNASKESMARSIKQRFGEDFKSNDECDAYGLACMGYQLLTGEIKDNPQQARALAKPRIFNSAVLDDLQYLTN